LPWPRSTCVLWAGSKRSVHRRLPGEAIRFICLTRLSRRLKPLPHRYVWAGIGVAVIILGLVFFSPRTPDNLQSASSRTTVTTGEYVTILSDNLTVGYNSGAWVISLTINGNVGVSKITAILSTPVEAKICGGDAGGLSFQNCNRPQAATTLGGPTILGYATGAGPGSAVVGRSYNVTVNLTLVDGRTSTITSSVIAQSQA
jgi:hypothetical protein